MAKDTIKTRIQLKNDTEANWSKATGFIAKQGEAIIYSSDDTHPFSRLKVGDGVTPVPDLPFLDAGTITGYTVNTNVPVNALFTDTTYNSLAARENGTDVSLVTTGEKYDWNNKTKYREIGYSGDYRRVVIALCELSADANSYIESYTYGTVVTIHINGLKAPYIATTTFQDCWSMAKSCHYSLFSNFENSSTTARDGNGYRACTFTYNGKHYGGLEFYQTQERYYYWTGIGTFEPFVVEYYNMNTQSVVKSEINNSLSYSTSTLIRSNFTIDNAKTVNNLTVQTAVPANAVFTDTTYTFDGTYNASTNKAATQQTVTNAINALDVDEIKGSTTKTITAISETNGKIAATYSDIAFPVTSVAGKTGAVVLAKGDVPDLSDTYLPLSGGTMTGTVVFNNETTTRFKINRKSSDHAGGWAYSGIYFIDKSNSDFANLGVYGVSNTLNYIYFGSYKYNDTKNLRIYPDGTIYGTLFSGSGASLTNLNASNLTTGTVPIERIQDASTSQKGVVQLSTATNSTSTTLAATASAVKAAYDLAASKTANLGTVTSITPGNGLINGISGSSKTAITTSGTISIETGGVTNDMLAGSIANTKLTNSSITIAGTSVSLGGSITAATLVSNLGLSSAMKYKGSVTTLPAATAANTYSAYNAGDVITISSTGKEYVYNKGTSASNSTWVELGDETSYKVKQDAVSDPIAAATTSTTFIDTISQNANGVISATKKTLPIHSVNSSYLTLSNGQVSVSKNNVSAMLNLLSVDSSLATVNDYLIAQYAGGGTSTTSYHRRTIANVVNSTVVKAALGTDGSTTNQWLNKAGTWSTPPNTWRGIQDNLTSTSTTDSLSANQGKILNENKMRYINTTDTTTWTADTLAATDSIAYVRGSVTGAYTTGHMVWLNASTIGAPFQLVIHDSNTDFYFWKRWKSSGVWQPWKKMNAGNADTADALNTNAGSATQPVFFSGGKPVACTAYASASVNYATSASQLTSNTRMEYGWNGLNYFNTSNANRSAAKVNDTPSSTSQWWHILRFNHSNSSGYYTDVAVPFQLDGIHYKRIWNGTLQNSTTNGGWVKVLDVLNTAAGSNNNSTLTWGTTYTLAKINDVDIKFTTMAKPSYSWSDITSKPSTFAPSAHTHNSLEPYASIGSSTTDHGVALKNWFSDSAPRNKLVSFYSSTSGNGSYYMGYFLTGYKDNPYGGFFVAHYNNAYYVGILNGTYTQQRLLTSTNYTEYTVTKTGSGASGDWGINITGTAATATRLSHISLNSTTINSTAGTFAFSGANEPWAGANWVGLQVGDAYDKFQLTVNGNHLLLRQNDNGGDNSTGWQNWVTLLDTSNYSSYITSYLTSKATGNATQPVYISSTGAITACTSYANATVGAADKLTGLSSRSTGMAWGNQTGTVITCMGSPGGGGWGFRDNNPVSGQMSMTIDGTIYIKEGAQDISAAIKSLSVSGQTVTWTNLWGTTGTITTQDTKNTAGSKNSASKLFLIGATSQATNPTTYSYAYTYVTNGLLSSTKLGLNASGTEKAHMEWNATDSSIDFIFN